MRHLLTLVALSLLSACSSSSSSSATCAETVHEVSDALERCLTEPRAVIEAEVEAGATSGRGCRAVARVRDEQALRERCFPALRVLSCDAVTRGELPGSCVSQLLLD